MKKINEITKGKAKSMFTTDNEDNLINKYNALGKWNDSPGGIIGIAEISLGPTYSISPTVSSSNEGGEIRTNVSTRCQCRDQALLDPQWHRH